MPDDSPVSSGNQYSTHTWMAGVAVSLRCVSKGAKIRVKCFGG